MSGNWLPTDDKRQTTTTAKKRSCIAHAHCSLLCISACTLLALSLRPVRACVKLYYETARVPSGGAAKQKGGICDVQCGLAIKSGTPKSYVLMRKHLHTT